MKIPPEFELPVSVRVDVHQFSSMMEIELKKNDHKRGYKDGHPLVVFAKLIDEIGEIGNILGDQFYAWEGDKYGPFKKSDYDEIIRECADVGNLAMFLMLSFFEQRAKAMRG